MEIAPSLSRAHGPHFPSLVVSPAAGSVTAPWQGWPCFLVKPNLMLAPMVPLGLTRCHPILPSVPGQPPPQTAAPLQPANSPIKLFFFFGVISGNLHLTTNISLGASPG